MARLFTKMHALGNDILIVNGLDADWSWVLPQIIALSDRRRGVGFDQLMIITHEQNGVFFVKIFNADGQSVQQCGNGLRCVAHHLVEQGHGTAPLQLGVGDKRYQAEVRGDEVSIDLGPPQWEHPELPDQRPPWAAADGIHAMDRVFLGNPHVVVRLKEGISLQRAQPWPNHGINVEWVQIIDRQHVIMRVFERGVGETPACGSGACAVVAVGQRAGWLASSVKVQIPGGTVTVHHHADRLRLVGVVQRVFQGQLPL